MVTTESTRSAPPAQTTFSPRSSRTCRHEPRLRQAAVHARLRPSHRSTRTCSASTAPTSNQLARIADTKLVIYEAFELPVTDGIDSQTAGLLVDEEYGAEVARRHRRTGGSWRCPSRRAPGGVRLEFGGNFGAHFETFDPAFANVLVRYNPDGDSVLNARQAIRLRRLSDWLHQRERKFLFELLAGRESST